MEYFDKYEPLDLVSDPLPLKVLSISIWDSELIGQTLDWSLQYLHQKRCPSHFISPLLGRILREVSTADLSQCFTESSGKRSSLDQVDSETVENVSYQPLRLMQMVTTKVDEICLRYKDNSERINTDFPHQSIIEDNVSPNIFGVSCHSIKNTRRTLEDRMVILPGLDKIFNLKVPTNFFAVYDGHNGVEAAAYSAAHLHHHLITSPDYPDDITSAINYAFEATDTALLMKCKNESIRSGTTAVIALVIPCVGSPGNIYVGWVGDSQAILVKNSKAVSLVSPHKPDREDEMRRIKGVGGEVISISGTWRVNGNLAVSRAIGNQDYKEYVTSTPEITHIQVDGTEECLILACDGLFDVVSPQRCVEIFRDTVLSENPSDIDSLSQKLVVEAKQSGSGDNITVVAVLLKSKEDLRQSYSSRKMNGIENPILETVSEPTLESVPPSLVEPLSNPLEVNMKLLESPPEPLIIEQKSSSPTKGKSVDSKSPRPKTAGPTRSATGTRTSTSAPLKSSTSSASKSPAGTRATPALAKSPVKTAPTTTTSKVSPGKVGLSTVTKITVQRDTVPGVSKQSVPTKSTITSATTRTQATKSALATKTKPPKNNETEKSIDPKTNLPPKTRPTTAPSNSRLIAAKSVKSDPSKVGDEKAGESTTTKSRQVPTRPTTASKESTTTTRVTQRPATAAPTSRPPLARPPTATSARPATAGLAKSGVSNAAPKPGVTKTTATKITTTQSAAKVPAPSLPKTQSSRPAVGKVPATTSQPRKAPTTTTSQPPPSKAPTRAPIKKPTVGDKKDVKVNGVVGKQQTIEAPKKVEAAQVNGEEEKVVNGNVANTESFMVTKPYELAENIVNHVNIEDGNVAVEESVEKSLFNNNESSIQPETVLATLETNKEVPPPQQDVPSNVIVEAEQDEGIGLIQKDIDTGMVIDSQDHPLVVDQDEADQLVLIHEPSLNQSFEVSRNDQSEQSINTEFQEKDQFEREILAESVVPELSEHVNDFLQSASIPFENTLEQVDQVVSEDLKEDIEKSLADEIISDESVGMISNVQMDQPPPTDINPPIIDHDPSTDFMGQSLEHPVVHSHCTESNILDQELDTHGSDPSRLNFDSKDKLEEPEEVYRTESVSPTAVENESFVDEGSHVFAEEPVPTFNEIPHQSYPEPQDYVEQVEADYFGTTGTLNQFDQVNTNEGYMLDKFNVDFAAPIINNEPLIQSDHPCSQLDVGSSSFEQVTADFEPTDVTHAAGTDLVREENMMLAGENLGDLSENSFDVQDTFGGNLMMGQMDEEPFSQPRNPFTDDHQGLIDSTYNAVQSEETKNPFGPDDVFSVDAGLSNPVDPFSKVGGELENPFYDEKNLFGSVATNDFMPQQFETQQQFEPFEVTEGDVANSHCYDNFIVKDEPVIPTDTSSRIEEQDDGKGLSTCDLMSEINSNIVNSTTNGVPKTMVDDLEVCLEPVRLEDNERKTMEKSEIIDTKVVLENNTSDKGGEVHKGLDLSSSVGTIEQLSDNAHEPTF